MRIIANRKTTYGHLIQLTFEKRGVYRVQIWTQDNLDWDWIEGTEEECRQIYELCEHIDDMIKT